EKTERRKKGTGGGKSGAEARRAAERRLDEITGQIEETESRVADIDAKFADPTFYEITDRDDVRALEEERARLQSEVESLMDEWQRVEEELE
ncbi:MAG: hypothetical protein WBN79_00110, partial [Gemmatimonadota bacterium]